MTQHIILSVDYHDRQSVVRHLTLPTREERVFAVPTTAEDIRKVLDDVRHQVGADGVVTWIQESTTGWARVRALVEGQGEFLLVNALQMPRTPKAHRRKTDKVDTARIQREYLGGTLPLAHQPRRNGASAVGSFAGGRTWCAVGPRCGTGSTAIWRMRPGLTVPACGDGLVSGGYTPCCRACRRATRGSSFRSSRNSPVWSDKSSRPYAQLRELLLGWPEAQRLDAIRGIDVVSAVSIVARIGPVERFPTAESLINYAGLSPGIQQSDQTRRCGRIGGGGTDKHLRHYIIEASTWARELPRYATTYDRVRRRRGKKVARLVVARMLLRSIYKILHAGVAFDPNGVRTSHRRVKQACS